MIIPWWLHRTLIVILMPICALVGVILGLYAAGLLDGILGRMTIIFIPLGLLLGAFIPHRIFRKCIHAKCPVDGERMAIERVTLPQRYPQDVPGTGTRYHCAVCGTIK
jgi:uncharacterized protein YneF (UPF0154 family)